MIHSTPSPVDKTIVLVDDESAYLTLLTEQVEINLNFPTRIFGRPAEALKALPDLNAGLLVTDFQMPELNGFEFIRKVQQILPNLPIIMITAVPEELPQVNMADFPSLKAIVHKPFGWAELETHIVRHWPKT